MNKKLYKSTTDSLLPKPSPKSIDIIQANSCFTKDITALTERKNDQSKLNAIRPITNITCIEKLPTKRLSNLLNINIDRTNRKSDNVENYNNSIPSAESRSPNHAKIKRNTKKRFSSTLTSDLEGITRPELTKFALTENFVKYPQKRSN